MQVILLRMVLILFSATWFVVVTLSAQVTGDTGRRRPGGLRPGAADQPPVLRPAEPAPGATIKRFGVAGPVTGGQGSFGLVELNAPAPAAGITIQLSSNNPAITVPATITVAPGADGQSFLITTASVASSTTATVSAKIGAAAAPQTATITILPPSLSFVSCTPQTVPAGTPTTCKVQLNATVASPSLGAEGDKRVSQLGRTALSASQLALTIALASSNEAVATVPPTVRIGAGQRSTNFTVATKPLAQSTSSLISASYGGVTKGTNVHVQSVSLAAVGCNTPEGPVSPCSYRLQYVGGTGSQEARQSRIRAVVKLTAPAPSGGLVVKLTDTPNLLSLRELRETEYGSREYKVSIVLVPEGKTLKQFIVRGRAVPADTDVTIAAFAPLTGDTRTMVISLKAPSVYSVGFMGTGEPPTVSGVPIGGREVTARVTLNGIAPAGGLAVDLTYSGTAEISGPARVTVTPPRQHVNFPVTVGPCAVADVCQGVVSTGSLNDTLFVKP